MEIISNKKTKIKEEESLLWHLGKKVVTKNGMIIGKVKDIIMGEKGIKGIILNHRFEKIFIDKDYIKEISEAVMLKIEPVTTLKNKLVFDADGRKIGKVTKIIRKNNKNDYQEIIVKKKMYTKEIKIPKKDIEVEKKNIILKNEFNNK